MSPSQLLTASERTGERRDGVAGFSTNLEAADCPSTGFHRRCPEPGDETVVPASISGIGVDP